MKVAFFMLFIKCIVWLLSYNTTQKTFNHKIPFNKYLQIKEIPEVHEISGYQIIIITIFRCCVGSPL